MANLMQMRKEHQEMAILWVPGCGNLHENDLQEKECPVCFDGNIKTILLEGSIRLMCCQCNFIGGERTAS